MTLGTGGEAYISNGIGGGVYLVRPGGRVLEALVNPGVLGSPQTPALGSDGRRLYVADYIRGIAMVDLNTRLVHWLQRPPECAVSGIDGLSFTGHSLLAVQNGTDPARLLRIRSRDGRRSRQPLHGARAEHPRPRRADPRHRRRHRLFLHRERGAGRASPTAGVAPPRRPARRARHLPHPRSRA